MTTKTARTGLRLATFVTTFFFLASAVHAAEFLVHKNAGCVCCDRWANHLRGHGHTVTIVPHDDMLTQKHELGVPEALWSCHTAIVDGYLIEGHVPAEDIQHLLAERPDALGLAVPGMPVGSPGMEMGNRYDAYDVILFKADGSTEVYASH